MAVYRRSKRHRFVLVLLVLTSITTITLDYREQGAGVIDAVRGGARDAFAPLESATERVLAPVGNFFGGLAHYSDLKAENARLRRQLQAARATKLKGVDAERERKVLYQLQHLDFAADVPTVATRVVASSPSNYQRTLEIDRGADAGVAKGMPVVSEAGLVGRVATVSRRRATVLLVTDPSFNVGVRLGSGDVGVARGAGAHRPLTLGLVDTATKVTVGEVVVTSGLQQSVFPPGIPVGRVKSAKTAPSSLQQDIAVDPVADLDRAEFLKVLRWSPP